jgi:hypothetical protein
MSKLYIFPALFAALLAAAPVQAGNPDRQGEAGAYQLLINPWARSAGFHTMNTANVVGTDAMFLNVAGLSRLQKMEIQLSHTRYLVGTDVNLNALAFGQRLGKSGALGINLVAMDLGDFDRTTVNAPEGAGGVFTPAYFNLGLSYSHLFAEKVSVGVTAKFVTESQDNVAAGAFALDAGVQYVTGPNDNFQFGISLRNVGTKMTFRGEGLSTQLPVNDPSNPFPSTFQVRPAASNLPTQLNIGMAYDFLLGDQNRLTVLGNFTSNAFSRDVVGAGVQFALGRNFAIRGGYKYEFEAPAGSVEASVDNGISGGLTLSVPVRKDSKTRLAIDYAYRYTEVWNGIHNLGLRLDL